MNSVTQQRGNSKPLKNHERGRLRDALHNGLGQALTSISFLAGSLEQKLAARKLPEATQAAEICALTGRAISEAQALVAENGSQNRKAHRKGRSP